MAKKKDEFCDLMGLSFKKTPSQKQKVKARTNLKYKDETKIVDGKKKGWVTEYQVSKYGGKTVKHENLYLFVKGCCFTRKFIDEVMDHPDGRMSWKETYEELKYFAETRERILPKTIRSADMFDYNRVYTER